MIDCHMHPLGLTDYPEYSFFEETGRIRDGALDNFFQAISDVERAIVLAFWAPKSEIRVSNRFTAAVVDAAPEKLVGFASVHPYEENAVEQLDEAISGYGLKGVKLAPLYQHFDPADERVWPLYERIQRFGLPIMWHQGASFMVPEGPFEYAAPSRLDTMARAFPEIPMVIAHFGFPWSHEVVALLRKHKHLYTDVSVLAQRPWFLYNALVQVMEYGALHKVLLGSDYPAYTARETAAALRRVNDLTRGTGLPRIPEDEIERIINQDSLQLLGIG